MEMTVRMHELVLQSCIAAGHWRRCLHWLGKIVPLVPKTEVEGIVARVLVACGAQGQWLAAAKVHHLAVQYGMCAGPAAGLPSSVDLDFLAPHVGEEKWAEERWQALQEHIMQEYPCDASDASVVDLKGDIPVAFVPFTTDSGPDVSPDSPSLSLDNMND